MADKRTDDQIREEKLLEIKQLKERRKKKQRGRQLISLAAVLVFVLLAFQAENIGKAINISHLFAETFSPGPGYPVSLKGKELKTFLDFRGDPAVLTTSEFVVYSGSGRSVLNIPHAYTNPGVHTSYNKVALFDMQGKGVSVYEDDNLMYQKKLEEQVINCRAASDGRCAVASTAAGYTSQMTLYSNTGAELYKWSSLDTNIMHMDFDGDQQGIVLSGVGVNGGTVFTNVVHLRFGSKEVSWKVTFSGEVPLYTAYMPGGKILVITDKAMRVLNGDGSESAVYAFNGRTLYGFYAKDLSAPVLIFRPYGTTANATVVTVASDGQEKGSFSLNSTIRDVSVSSGKIYLLTSRGVFRYNAAGEKDEWTSEETADGQQFKIFSGSGYVYAADYLIKINL